MRNIINYMNDGAEAISQAVLAYLKYQIGDGIEESWNDTYNKYDANIQIGRWENGREQGYVVYMKTPSFNQINIAFFQHRNSDQIHAVKWEQDTINTPTLYFFCYSSRV
jgi:hypothetical protein